MPIAIVVKTCDFCKARFITKKSIVTSGRGKFCSKKCKYDSRKILNLYEYFLSKITIPETADGCWLWGGHIAYDGYGIIKCSGKRISVHRYSYETWYGPVSEGLFVLHSCDIRRCCRPDHLREGTQKENLRDMMVRGRSLRGEKNPRTLLTEVEVKMIRVLYNSENFSYSLSDLSSMFGVSMGCINGIVNYRNWKHVD